MKTVKKKITVLLSGSEKLLTAPTLFKRLGIFCFSRPLK